MRTLRIVSVLALAAGALLPLVGALRGGAMVLRQPHAGIVIEIPFAAGLDALVFDTNHAAWPAWATGGSLSLGPAYYGAVLSVTLTWHMALAVALAAVGVTAAWRGRRSRG